MNKLWTVDPDAHWYELHPEVWPQHNLPETPRCPETFMGKQCELIEGHTTAHVLLTTPLQPVE